MAKLAKVEGEVITKDGRGNAIEFFEEEFVLDDSIKTAAEARMLIKKGLIVDRLRKSVKNYKRVRTCQIIEFTTTNQAPEQTDMDKLLMKCMELNCLPENLENYKRPDYKQKALERAITNAEERLRKTKPDNMQDLGEVQ